MLLRARCIWPVSDPVIEDGAILIKGGQIVRVCPWKELNSFEKSRAIDLGEMALMPGLVNAHCHLDYTDMAGQMPPPKEFTDWLMGITSNKAGWNFSDFAASWLNGARMLVNTGTTTVADIEAVPELLPHVWESTPLRVISFLEMTGIKARRSPAEILKEAVKRIETLSGPHRRLGLSPHAPYSTLPELLRLTGEIVRKRKWRACVHVAESATEFEMFTQAKGRMHDWIQRSGRDMSDCGRGSPVQYLETCGLLGKEVLAVHANYLDQKDAELLSRRKVSVVHCPRSHAYFRHGSFAMNRLLKAGVNVCLGTDSLASVWKGRGETVELSMFEEMRAVSRSFPQLSLETIFRMTTVNGGRALGLGHKIGALRKGAFADLISIPFAGTKRQLSEAMLRTKKVTANMVGGKWATAPLPI